ncbi:hypothetical protein [Singulisphaera sp. PoT]|uniref:hypothetical protein n=1 Tax=Singulisphaera sp. PoT TaxID=3411797 RepID=UPI003BF4D87A
MRLTNEQLRKAIDMMAGPVAAETPFGVRGDQLIVLMTEVLERRQEVRVARALITDAGLWQKYRAELNAAKRRRRK